VNVRSSPLDDEIADAAGEKDLNRRHAGDGSNEQNFEAPQHLFGVADIQLPRVAACSSDVTEPHPRVH
jgi:hypothetical protein